MNNMFAWQETKVGLAVIAVLNLFIAYVWASLAINSGSLLQWFIAMLFFVLAITHAVKFVRKLRRK